MKAKVVLSLMVLAGNCLNVAFAGPFDQAPKATLVAGAPAAAPPSGMRHGGMEQKSLP